MEFTGCGLMWKVERGKKDDLSKQQRTLLEGSIRDTDAETESAFCDDPKPKEKIMKNLKLAILAAALAAAGSASASITVTIDSVIPGEIVNLVVTPTVGSLVPAYSGGVYAGIYNLTVNGSPSSTPTFCIDVAHDVYLGETFHDYSYTTLASAPDSPAGPMTSTEATDIKKLWAAYYSEAVNNPVTAAALQVAIWETLGNGQLLGNGSPGYTVTVGGNSAVTVAADGMIAALYGPNALTAEANVNALVSPDGQGYAADPVDLPPSVVPEPTTIISGVLMLLPFGASTLRILRRNRTPLKNRNLL
jgi:hypothetical protein